MGRMRAAAAVAAALALAAPFAVARGEEPLPQHTFDLRVEVSDGTSLLVRLGGRGPLVDGNLPPRPVIAEFSPYGPGCCAEHGGPDYNYLQVHIRGTGDSDGSFDALGPRSQHDLAEVLGWACGQPWSDGRIGLWGFSASAIVVYNSLHHRLPCLKTAVLGSGTHELYRDLLVPGGIPNGLPALGVLGLISAPAMQLLPERLERSPGSVAPLAAGLAQQPVDYTLHPTLDEWWHERGMRGDANGVPMLMVNGFFDVESRGAFEAFQELAGNGSHLYVVGAHDGVPAGSGGAGDMTRRWFDRWLRGVANGVDGEPAVRLWMANGDRVRMLGGDFVTASADAWPVPGTQWVPLYLRAARSGTAQSTNDGTLDPSRASDGTPTLQPYVPISSLPSATDPYTT